MLNARGAARDYHIGRLLIFRDVSGIKSGADASLRAAEIPDDADQLDRPRCVMNLRVYPRRGDKEALRHLIEASVIPDTAR